MRVLIKKIFDCKYVNELGEQLLIDKKDDNVPWWDLDQPNLKMIRLLNKYFSFNEKDLSKESKDWRYDHLHSSLIGG